MLTRLIDVSGSSDEIIAEAGEMIRRGELVAFPTETVYGLGANAFDPNAVRAIFSIKQRPNDKPLSLHVASVEMIDRLAIISDIAERLIEKFLPGPLTLILPSRSSNSTIGIRMPDNDTALALIRAAGVPIAAPSANISGRPSPRTAQEVLAELDGKIPLILDGGECRIGVASTIVDVSTDELKILRAGSITRGAINDAIENEE